MHSLPVSSLAYGYPALGSVGCMVGLMATSKRVYAKGTFPACCCQCPHPCGVPLLTNTSTGDPPTLAGNFCSISCRVTTPFSYALVHTRFCYPFQDWRLCFPQSCGSPIIKPCWPSRPDSLGTLTHFVRSPNGKPDVGFITFTTVG